MSFSKEIFPRSEGLARLAYQFAEKYEKIGGRSDRKRAKELYAASPDSSKPCKKVTSSMVLLLVKILGIIIKLNVIKV